MGRKERFARFGNPSTLGQGTHVKIQSRNGGKHATARDRTPWEIRATVHIEQCIEFGRLGWVPSKGSRSAFEATERRRKRQQVAVPSRYGVPKAQVETCDCLLTDPETGVASGKTKAAICVQDVDVQCVLQFTLIHAAGCALHRHTSRVIHRLEL